MLLLGSNPGLLPLCHRQSDALTTLLDLIQEEWVRIVELLKLFQKTCFFMSQSNNNTATVFDLNGSGTRKLTLQTVLTKLKN
jgi:hypothetical protein